MVVETVGEFRETLTAKADGNPEPSLGYILGRCRDYLRTTVSLITGFELPLPYMGKKIVRADTKVLESLDKEKKRRLTYRSAMKNSAQIGERSAPNAEGKTKSRTLSIP